MRRFFLYLLLGFSLIYSFQSFSQTTLAAGDVAITSFNTDGDDEFSFVLLKDITSGTKIYFTENGWDDDANGGGVAPTWGTTGEGTLTWTSTSAMSCGTEIQVITPKLNATLMVSAGSISKSGTWGPGPSGDAIIVYQGTAKPTDGSEVTAFLWAFNSGSSGFVPDAASNTTTSLPTGLTEGANAVYGGTSDNYKYDCSTLGAVASLKTALATAGNFLTNNTNTTNYKASGCSYYCTSVDTWSGATDTDWNTAGNWSGGIPTNATTISIPNVTNMPIISTATTAVANNLTIDLSASLTLNSGGNLTISSNITNNGTFTVNSDATTSGSLIVTTTATGNITYKRYMTGVDKWHLIAAPVGGQDINTFVTTGSNNVGFQSPNYSLTPYDNTVAKGVSGIWNHWTSDGSGAGNISGAGSFVAGKGYEVLRTANGTMAFTGTVPVLKVSISVTNPVSNNAWNLIGNPFPSSIPANNNANTNNNFLTVNTSVMDANFVALYLWNPTTSLYDKIINNASSATYIAPGQGFFVKSVAAGGTVDFTTAMRTNQLAVAFQKMSSATPSITLIADDGNKTKTTDIKYIAGKSLGLDPGYDAGLFDASGGNFTLYTKLVEDNGVNFMLQVLPDSIYDTTIIPIGLDADVGSEINFKADISNLPIGKKVFLEDKLLNTVTELNATDKTYTFTLTTQEQGTGRFFLHTQDNQSTLATQEFNTLGISVIVQPKNNSIRILGNINGTTKLAIYDMLGRNIFSIEYKLSNDNELSIPPMTQGIYIVKVESEKGNYSTKIAWY
ncbi:MAG: T9SS type A sorting domain-containing protein [Flavobacteriaceae bacterium]